MPVSVYTGLLEALSASYERSDISELSEYASGGLGGFYVIRPA